MNGPEDFKKLEEMTNNLHQDLADSALEMNVVWIKNMEFLRKLASGITPANKSEILNLMDSYMADCSEIIAKHTH